MPISSPSYFPPNRSTGTVVGLNAGNSTTGSRNFLAGKAAGKFTTISDLIVIGDSALSAGTSATNVSDAHLAGSVAIGSNAAAAITNAPTANFAALTCVGINALAAGNFACGVYIGDQAAASSVGSSTFPLDDNVVIGSGAAQFVSDTLGSGRLTDNVIIGHNAGQSTSGGNGGTIAQSVLIGRQAADGAASNLVQGLTGCVVIGDRAGRNVGTDPAVSANFSVIIGENCAINGISPQSSVLIGQGITVFAATNSPLLGVCIGAGATIQGDTTTNIGGCIVIGANAAINGSAAKGAIAIGKGCGGEYGSGFPTQSCLIEWFNGSTYQACFFGDMSNGNVVLGNSTSAAGNRDLSAPTAAANALKILNGSKAVANPSGGGYFYVSAGALHWVGSSGTDTTVAVA